jgi:hypothetical protein
MSTEQSPTEIAEKLAAAGISSAQINLALETSATLLELLASYGLDGTHKQTITEIFAKAAETHDRNTGR